MNVVTKSGTTTETVTNFAYFYQLIKAKRPQDYHKYIVVTTDEGSPLDKIAQKEQFSTLYIPKKVGGRYSVFSPVGLFPLAMIGIDVKELLRGAHDSIESCTATEIANNFAAVNAIIKYAHYKKGVNINDFFVFSVQLESVGKWYRQLMGESIGKEFNVRGERVEVGITPTVSIGTLDLHSVGQLYLGGPRDKFTTFVSVENYQSSEDEKPQSFFPEFLADFKVRPLSFIMKAILQGVQVAYTKNKRPFCSLVLPALKPYYIGQLLQMYMIEMMYLGYLLEVNPFDQPNVELYKKETRKILTHE